MNLPVWGTPTRAPAREVALTALAHGAGSRRWRAALARRCRPLVNAFVKIQCVKEISDAQYDEAWFWNSRPVHRFSRAGPGVRVPEQDARGSRLLQAAAHQQLRRQRQDRDQVRRQARLQSAR